MAIASAQLGSWGENGGVVATLAYNDANNAVQSVTVANSAFPVAVTIWQMGQEASAITQTIAPGPPVTLSQLPGNLRYSVMELPDGDPRAGNVGLSVRYPA